MPDPDTAGRRDPTPGAYVHIPFCARRCDYCDFTTYADRDHVIDAYVHALVAHLLGWGPAQVDALAGPVASVFVGGGTPTYLPPEALARVLAGIRDGLSPAADAEVTVEANPETVTPEIAEALAAGGVTRVSLGAQSFDHAVLRTLGRWHEPASIPTALERLRDVGIDRLSLDLIYGTPGETDASWAASLRHALDLGVSHVSAYALTVEANTPYATRARALPALLPDDDVQADRMEAADAALRAAGLVRYEVSNWAAPGHESRHNLNYWRGGDWLAYGCGAHGHVDGRRWWLRRAPERYAADVAGGTEPIGGEERLDADDRRLERLMMGLRLVEGAPRSAIEPLDEAVLARLVGGGLLTATDDRVAATPEGMARVGGIIAALA